MVVIKRNVCQTGGVACQSYASGYDFHGYHALNMRKIDPRLESDGATYQTLIDEAYKRGIKIIQDIVLNHTSNSGEEGMFPLVDRSYTLK